MVPGAYASSKARRNSSLVIPAWFRIARRVEDLMNGWLGMVIQSEPPTGLGRRIAMCSASRITWNPRRRKAARTLFFGTSTGNFPILCGDGGFSQEGFQDLRIAWESLRAKGLDVEFDGGFCIG